MRGIADFNFYAQTAALKFNIDAIDKNWDSRHMELEGEEENLNLFIKYMREGALEKQIESFHVEK